MTPTPRGCSARPPLHLQPYQASVYSGGVLTLRIHTASHARVALALHVLASKIVTSGAGKHRKRAIQMRVLYEATQQGRADAHGQYHGALHITYRPGAAMPAHLLVTAGTGCSAATSSGRVTIVPLLALVLPRTRVVSGTGLPVTVNTLPGAPVSAVAQVVARRVVITGVGIHRRGRVRVRVLYRAAVAGRADSHGRFKAELHIGYRASKPVGALLTISARTVYGAASRSTQVIILPRRARTVCREIVTQKGNTVVVTTRCSTH